MPTVVPRISDDYNVRIISTEVVLPAPPLQHRIHPLSNLDLTIPPISFCIYFCYVNPCDRTFESALSHLKTSLSEALATYYVFAGRLVINSVGLPQVVCNNKGVQFTQAYVAACLSHLNIHNVEKTVQRTLLAPFLKETEENGLPVFAVQILLPTVMKLRI
ncbi:hypothetical protein KI387_033802, partial [Taxus chinensis]